MRARLSAGFASSISEAGGIRDIAWSPAHQEYLIIGGQADDDDPGPGSPFFGGQAKKVTSHGASAPLTTSKQIPHFHPEAIVPLRMWQPANIRKRFLLISDDGTKPMPQGGVCKDANENGKSFRAIKTVVP